MTINTTKYLLFSLFLITQTLKLKAEDGYDLWLRYVPIKDEKLLSDYRKQLKGAHFFGNSPTIQAATEELNRGLTGLLALKRPLSINDNLSIGTAENMPFVNDLGLKNKLQTIGNEGFMIFSNKDGIIITANTDVGVLYGVFHFLRLIQTQQSLKNLNIIESPKTNIRMLNHWDNLNRTVERGYAGFSLWDWHRLPDYVDTRYTDYARANASIGINSVVLTNVNANALILTPQYLEKVKVLANIFRTYGIKVYLTARFSAPIELDKLKTADPTDPSVQQWWKDKTDEIYRFIPDFGGFLVKANSEGQPGPQNYGRNHADGANMLADAVAPHKGIVMWRAFVYSDAPEDRFKKAYNEFKPLDGSFRKNVIVQVKNGPIDFQPREPFSPLFGAMPKTPLMVEFQITQEYLGQATNLVFLAPMFKECLDADTYAKGGGATVAKIVDGSIDNQSLTGMAGVANIGTDLNWCGHPFAQANWYAFGRLAWNHDVTSEQIADEWLKMTFSMTPKYEEKIKYIMLNSRENVVNYMTPLGLNHIMGYGHHYGPAPWINTASRPDWNCTYFHKADSIGIGFDRTATGSNAVAQYNAPLSAQFSDPKTCPDQYLLWFHHLNWDFKMRSNKTLWEELCAHYYAGTDAAKGMRKTWQSVENQVDKDRFEQVKMLLLVQEKEAIWWRNACVLYFQTHSKMPIPMGFEQPDKSLDYYKSLKFPYAPGN
jgi:alpha-glucuronidase